MSTSQDDSPAKSRFRCDGTFDIECADWDRFVVGCIYAPGDQATHHDPDDFVNALLTRRGHYWAHAGGVYDLLFVSERLRARGIRFHCDLSQHRVTRIQVGGVTLRDSYSLIPFPLDEAATIAGEKAPELPWSCICRRKCGGYCRITQKAREGDPELERYCMEDCRVLYRVIHTLHEHCQEHGIDLRGTLGGTAWATAKAQLCLPDASLTWDEWRHVRLADKGGRVAVFRPVHRGPGTHWDIVNAYPAALARASVPIGASRQLGSRNALGALARDVAGIYSCTVTVPADRYVPPLPWRHGGRTHYPTGTFTGTWALPEIVAAVQRGTTVDAVHSGMIWEGEAQLFGDLMRDWYALRASVGKNTTLGQWHSRRAKALTGKFAEQPTRERITVHPKTIKVCPRTGRCRNGCTKRCGAMDQLDLFGYVWSAPYFKLSASGHCHWSAYLRAHTRVQWLEAAERFAPGEICYGDTDSLWTTGNTTPLPVADILGAWEMKHAWSGLEVRAPKIYRFTDGEGRKIFRGAPGMTEKDWRKGKGVGDRGVLTFRQAAHGAEGNLFRRRARKWSIPSRDQRPEWYGDRQVDPMSGLTYPPTADQVREKVRRDSEQG